RAITSPLDGSTVYVDLNAAGVQVHSDADFPDWQGWAFIDDDTDGNSRCDSARLLQRVLDELPPEPPVPGATPEAQRRQRLIRAHIAAQMDPIRQRLSR
ncbi:hypothetical protein, partial [Dyella sp. ASV21]|uniref:hypothetical protein n=1 Tax=Dyella sp. ASV21 TaxID=2795114 RepID=UPI0018ED23AE